MVDGLNGRQRSPLLLLLSYCFLRRAAIFARKRSFGPTALASWRLMGLLSYYYPLRALAMVTLVPLVAALSAPHQDSTRDFQCAADLLSVLAVVLAAKVATMTLWAVHQFAMASLVFGAPSAEGKFGRAKVLLPLLLF